MTTLQRPVQLLYPLGITQAVAENSTTEDTSTSQDAEPEEVTSSLPPNPRPQRESASRARDKLRTWTAELLEEDEQC